MYMYIYIKLYVYVYIQGLTLTPHGEPCAPVASGQPEPLPFPRFSYKHEHLKGALCA